MKKLKDFIFCDSVLTSQTVFYLVAVGSSKKDRDAHKFVATLARSPDFLFCAHNAQSVEFIENCAQSIFHVAKVPEAVRLLRRQYVTICWLASFLRKNPPTLLNSMKISPMVNNVYVNTQNKAICPIR